MLEEQQDNLHDADGNPENIQPENDPAKMDENTNDAVESSDEEILQPESTDGADEPTEDEEELVTADEQDDVVRPLDEIFAEEGKENEDVPEDLISERENDDQQAIEGNPEPPYTDTTDETSNAAAIAGDENDMLGDTAGMIQSIEMPEEEIPEQAATEEEHPAMAEMAESNAEESEVGTSTTQEMPMKDYESMAMEDLVHELEAMVSAEKVMAVKDHVEEIRKAFMGKFQKLVEDKKQEFHNENPESTEDFHYHSPLKTRFDQLYSQYRDRKSMHFKSLENNLKSNLENRMAIVEELKELINPQENIKDTLKHFNELRERWKNAGPIPKDKYNHVWNNYHFHVENFYDYLHLDREARDLDFRHNLDQKQKIIARVEQLVNEPDINKAFRELQDLHRIWKEDIGPVGKEHREEIWNRFSELTKQMHDKREALFEKQRGTETENLEKKKTIIAQLETLAKEKVDSHQAWLGQIEKVEALRSEFFATGKVPTEVNEETWNSFKTAVRDFNSLKNSFYKDIKKDQNDNLSKKQALVARARELQESTDFAATTPIMKQIQEEWKHVGHVPRKFSDKLWKEFKAACNHYFEKMKEHRTEENSEEVEAFEKKKAYLETLKDFQLTGEHKTDLDAIKAHIETWKSFGRVPQSRRHIEGKFNKVLDALFEKLSLSKKDSEMMRFSNRMENLSESNDSRKLEGEKIFLMRKIDEVQSEILQLENNIQFFANAKKDNPMVLEVRKNIDRHKEELETLRSKLKQVRSIKQE